MSISPATVTIQVPSARWWVDRSSGVLAGVYVLTRAHEVVTGNGGELRLALGDSPVARIFQLTGLDKVMPVYPDGQ
jgi:hypothetical protein